VTASGITPERVAARDKRRITQSTALYERLGGVYAIAAVVDDFIDRSMTDPRLNTKPKVDGGASPGLPGLASSTS
jgi:hypothetical protein